MLHQSPFVHCRGPQSTFPSTSPSNHLPCNSLGCRWDHSSPCAGMENTWEPVPPQPPRPVPGAPWPRPVSESPLPRSELELPRGHFRRVQPCLLRIWNHTLFCFFPFLNLLLDSCSSFSRGHFFNKPVSQGLLFSSSASKEPNLKQGGGASGWLSH